MEVTQAILDYTQQKVGKVVSKHREFVTKCEVHISVNGNPSVAENHIATATLSVKGNIIRDTSISENMYASIDAMSDAWAASSGSTKSAEGARSTRARARSAPPRPTRTRWTWTRRRRTWTTTRWRPSPTTAATP